MPGPANGAVDGLDHLPTRPHADQPSDDRVFGVPGVQVEGIEKLRRLPAQQIEVTAPQLVAAREWQIQAEAARQLTNTSVMSIGLFICWSFRHRRDACRQAGRRDAPPVPNPFR